MFSSFGSRRFHLGHADGIEAAFCRGGHGHLIAASGGPSRPGSRLPGSTGRLVIGLPFCRAWRRGDVIGTRPEAPCALAQGYHLDGPRRPRAAIQTRLDHTARQGPAGNSQFSGTFRAGGTASRQFIGIQASPKAGREGRRLPLFRDVTSGGRGPVLMLSRLNLGLVDLSRDTTVIGARFLRNSTAASWGLGHNRPKPQGIAMSVLRLLRARICR